MGSKDWDEICAKLAQDPELTAAFTAVYPDGWNGKNVTDAIAEYEKTLITPNSRFDKWLKGDDKALTAQEIEGYQRFKMYRCSSCHVGKSVGGQSSNTWISRRRTLGIAATRSAPTKAQGFYRQG